MPDSLTRDKLTYAEQEAAIIRFQVEAGVFPVGIDFVSVYGAIVSGTCTPLHHLSLWLLTTVYWSTIFAPQKKRTMFNYTHRRVKILHMCVCVCLHLHWGEASLFTYLEESLLFNLSSVKLTYCLLLTARLASPTSTSYCCWCP